MPKPKAFTLGGKPLNLNGVGGVAKSARRYLDRLPDGSLVTTKELAAALGFTGSSLLSRAEQLSGYFVRHGHKHLWASKQTIRDAEAELGDND